MRDEDRIRILHMIDAAETVAQFMEGRSRDDLDRDRMLLFALVHAIEVLGEAASKVSPDARAAAPQIPWATIVSMRNRPIHGDFDIDTAIVWKTATVEVPARDAPWGVSTVESTFPAPSTSAKAVRGPLFVPKSPERSPFLPNCPAIRKNVPVYLIPSPFLAIRPFFRKNVPLYLYRSPFIQNCPRFRSLVPESPGIRVLVERRDA